LHAQNRLAFALIGAQIAFHIGFGGGIEKFLDRAGQLAIGLLDAHQRFFFARLVVDGFPQTHRRGLGVGEQAGGGQGGECKGLFEHASLL